MAKLSSIKMKNLCINEFKKLTGLFGFWSHKFFFRRGQKFAEIKSFVELLEISLNLNLFIEEELIAEGEDKPEVGNGHKNGNGSKEESSEDDDDDEEEEEVSILKFSV